MRVRNRTIPLPRVPGQGNGEPPAPSSSPVVSPEAASPPAAPLGLPDDPGPSSPVAAAIASASSPEGWVSNAEQLWGWAQQAPAEPWPALPSPEAFSRPSPGPASPPAPSEAPLSGETSLSGPLDDGSFEIPSSWGGVPPEVWRNVAAPPAPANYPPLPRPYFPTKTSMVAHPPPGGSSDTLEMQGPPSGMTAAGGTLPSAAALASAPAVPALAPVSGSASAVMTRPAMAAPRRTMVLLGQTASVEAPGATPEREMMLSSVDGVSPLRALPPDAPAWMLEARALSSALEFAIEQGHANPFLQAAIRRAVQVFRLSGHPPAQIARLCHLLDRAYMAIRSTMRDDLEGVFGDCAQVLHRSLPAELRRRHSPDEVREIVRLLHAEPDLRRARMLALKRMFGWPDLPEDWLFEIMDTSIACAP